MGIFSMFVRLGLDASQFEAGAKRAQSIMSKLDGHIGSGIKKLAGAFTLGAVTHKISSDIEEMKESVISYGDAIKSLSENYQLSTEDAQKMAIAAKNAGLEVNSLAALTIKVGEWRRRISGGDVGAANLATRFGLSEADTKGGLKSNAELAYAIADAFAKSAKSARDQADLVDIAGTKSVALFSALSKMHQMGPLTLLDDKQLAAIAELKSNREEFERMRGIAGYGATKSEAELLREFNSKLAGKKFSENPILAWLDLTAMKIGGKTMQYVGNVLDIFGIKEAGQAVKTGPDGSLSNWSASQMELERKREELGIKPKEMPRYDFAAEWIKLERDKWQAMSKPSSLGAIGGFMFDASVDKRVDMDRQSLAYQARIAKASESTAAKLEADSK